MPPPPPSGRRGSRPSLRPQAKPAAKVPLDEDRMRIERVLEDLRRQEAELRKIQEKTEREMEELPRRLAERRQLAGLRALRAGHLLARGRGGLLALPSRHLRRPRRPRLGRLLRRVRELHGWQLVERRRLDHCVDIGDARA